jgi:hypothetical protein
MMLNSSKLLLPCDLWALQVSLMYYSLSSLPTYTISVRSQCIHGPQVIKKFQLMCLRAKSHFVQTYETAGKRTVNQNIPINCIRTLSWHILFSLLNKLRRILGSVRVV